MIQWPALLGGKNKLVGWLNKLLRCARASEIKQVVGPGHLRESTDGKILVITTPTPAGVSYPFRIYQGSTWLKYKVTTGWVALSSTPFEPSNPDTELTVTSAVAKYYVYLDVGTSTAEFKVSSTALSWSTQLVLIGWIDTDTYSGEERGVITQFRKEHIQTCAA